MAYTVEFTSKAVHAFGDLPRNIQVRLASRIDGLVKEPRPPGVEKLSGADDLYRLRVGDYRVIYQIKDKLLLVLVVTVGHRREVYRRPSK